MIRMCACCAIHVRLSVAWGPHHLGERLNVGLVSCPMLNNVSQLLCRVATTGPPLGKKELTTFKRALAFRLLILFYFCGRSAILR